MWGLCAPRMLNNGHVRATVKDVAARAGVSPEDRLQRHQRRRLRAPGDPRARRTGPRGARLRPQHGRPRAAQRAVRAHRAGPAGPVHGVLGRARAPLRRGGPRAGLVRPDRGDRRRARRASASCSPGRGRTWSRGSCSTRCRSRTRRSGRGRGPLPPTVLIGEVVQDTRRPRGRGQRARRAGHDGAPAGARAGAASRWSGPHPGLIETAAARQRDRGVHGSRSRRPGSPPTRRSRSRRPPGPRPRRWTLRGVPRRPTTCPTRSSASRTRWPFGVLTSCGSAGCGCRTTSPSSGFDDIVGAPVRGAAADHGGLRPAGIHNDRARPAGRPDRRPGPRRPAGRLPAPPRGPRQHGLRSRRT